MAFPRKFRSLLEIERGDMSAPDYVWLVYAVCAISEQSCGWGGWMIDAAFRKSDGGRLTSTGDALIPAQDSQVCPRCGLETFRTGASVRMAASEDQTPPMEPGKDYEAVPIEYLD